MHSTSPPRRCLTAVLFAGAAACALAAALPVTAASGAPGGPDLAGIDRAVAPGDDFFRYANGAWLAATEIPPDRSSYGAGAIVDERTLQRTVEVIKNAGSSGDSAKVSTYYAAYLDEGSIESAGLKPLAPELARIDAIKDRGALAQVLGATLRTDVDVLNNTNLHTENLFGLWIAQDLSDPKRYLPFMLQGGLVMPDRDYYLNPSQKMAEIRTQYQAHIAAMLGLANVADAPKKAAAIFALERHIAQAHWSRQESEDVRKGNNHWSRADFGRRAPGLEWEGFFASAGLAHQDEYIVWQPSAITGIARLVGSEPLDTWKDLLRFHLIEANAVYLPKALDEEHFKFHSRILSGTPQQRARWKRAVDQTSDALGEAVGRLYVERYFPPSEKARAEAMVKNLLAAFAVRIDQLDWMAPQTKARAKAKLAVLKVGVGYPDHWRSYAGLRVEAGDAFGNAQRARLFQYQYDLAKLGKPVDRSEWVMNPQLVNAVNLPAMNALNFPAAILQPPFFDPQRDPVMDYGATGAVIGHEISHSFDNQGALFDASGRLENWWTKEDFAHFEAAGERLAAQYDAYRPYPDIHVNGKQTLSENIADVAGLSAAYDAWRLTLKGAAGGAVQGFSPEQLFFVSFAQSWRQKMREAELRRRIVTDGHAPDEYRADTVRNLDPWYAAFTVRPGQKLYLTPAERVRVW